MLGLADFLRAVRGSAALALRRAHPLTGPVLLVVLGVVGLGSLFLWSGADSGSVDGAAARTEREVNGTRTSETGDDGDDGQQDRTVPGAAEADTDGVLDPTTTTTAPADAALPEDRAADGAEVPAPTSPPPTNRPSYETTAPRPTTTSSSPPSSPATTAPPDEGGGGLVGDLLDILGLG